MRAWEIVPFNPINPLPRHVRLCESTETSLRHAEFTRRREVGKSSGASLAQVMFRWTRLSRHARFRHRKLRCALIKMRSREISIMILNLRCCQSRIIFTNYSRTFSMIPSKVLRYLFDIENQRSESWTLCRKSRKVLFGMGLFYLWVIYSTTATGHLDQA